MYINTISNLLFLSPLEQFEISSFFKLRTYTTTYPVDFLEINLVYTPIAFWTIIDFVFFIGFLKGISFFIKENGYFFLYIFLSILLTCFNFFSFTDFVMLKGTFLNKSENYLLENMLWLALPNDVIVSNMFNNFVFVTLNTSFVNIYTITFCFIFIFLTIYLLFNRTFSNHSNTLVPQLYSMLGENIFKVSLNLFISVLGKHIARPEFFIKINTIFLFLIISNAQGMIPYMNTLTSALTNTFFIALALFINILLTLFDYKGFKYFLNLFLPSGCPIFLILLLVPIEIISYSFRVVSLSVRLFANMMAGHTLLKVIVGFSWVIVFLGNLSLINLFPIIILFILTLLEFGVAFIQSYIFTILSCIYLRDIFEGH